MAKEGLQFEFSASTAEYRKAVESMPRDLQKAADQIEQIGDDINASMSQAVGRGLIQGLAGAGVALRLRHIISEFDQVSDAAKRFGTSAEDIQRVDFAAKSAGSSMESVASAMESAGVRANRAAREGGALAEAFNRAGIDATAFSMADLSERIEMVGRVQNAASGDAQQLANITEALGQSVGGVDFASMAEGMRDVNVLSNETVRQLSQANSEIVKFEKNVTLVIGSLLGGLADVSERIGSIIAKEGQLGALQRALMLLTPAAPFAFMGGQTIEEMEKAEEALSGLPPLFEKTKESADQASLATINYSDVLQQLISVNTEMEASMARMEKSSGSLGEQLAEAELRLAELSQQFAQSGEAELFKEIEKTAKEILTLRQRTAKEEEKIRNETAKTSEEYRKQADAQARSIVSLDEEIKMLEAKLSGNKELTDYLQRQQDFRKAFEKTKDSERADKLADLLSRERQMAQGGQGAGQGGSAGGSSFGSLADRSPTRNERIGEMRGDFRAREAYERAADLESRGMFASADAARRRGDRRRESAMQDARLKDLYETGYGGAGNFGEAYQNYRDQTPLKGRLTEEQLDKFNKAMLDMATSPEERKKMEEEMRAKHEGKGKGKSAADEIFSLLKQHLPNIDEKLPQTALVYS